MKVFISWSGKRSKETAEALSSWIRQVIQAAETWISSDIEKGARWNEKISKELEQTKVGIICLNKENLSSEWILFEAGALSKTQDAHVCTFLLDIKPADVKPPLGQFQHTLFNKEDIKKLIVTINNKINDCGEKTIHEKDLLEIFDDLWPKIGKKLNSIKEKPILEKLSHRTDRDLLEELLQYVRTISSKLNQNPPHFKLNELLPNNLNRNYCNDLNKYRNKPIPLNKSFLEAFEFDEDLKNKLIEDIFGTKKKKK